MKLLCDEKVKYSAVNLLRQEGHAVDRVQDALELGFSDDDIVDYCRRTDPVVLTNDDDLFSFDDHPEILFLDEHRASPREIAVAIRRVERYVDRDALANTVYHVPDGWL